MLISLLIETWNLFRLSQYQVSNDSTVRRGTVSRRPVFFCLMCRNVTKLFVIICNNLSQLCSSRLVYLINFKGWTPELLTKQLQSNPPAPHPSPISLQKPLTIQGNAPTNMTLGTMATGQIAKMSSIRSRLQIVYR